MDRLNFTMLVNLDHAADVIGKMPEGQYKEFATLALAVKQVEEAESP